MRMMVFRAVTVLLIMAAGALAADGAQHDYWVFVTLCLFLGAQFLFAFERAISSDTEAKHE